MLEENRLEDTYEDKNPVTRIYFRTKVWVAIRTARLKKEIWNGEHHFDVVWSKEELDLQKYVASEESPSITPIFSPNPLIRKGKGNE